MKAKVFEVRDRATMIPVMAVKLAPARTTESQLLLRAGFGHDPSGYVITFNVDGGEGQFACNTYDHKGRTMQVAHQFIQEHFDELLSGSVVDVEYVLGEVPQPKVSEL